MTHATERRQSRRAVTYRCKCGAPIVVKNEVAAEAFRQHVATGRVDALCDECRREVGKGTNRTT